MSSLVDIDWAQVPAPYALPDADKLAFLMPRLDALTRHHYARCEPYRNIVERMFGGLRSGPYERLEDLPFFPVSLFKERELVSIQPSEIFKVLTSSGTTGQQVSRVMLDRVTADAQARALVKIMQYFLGKERLPMVILDHPGVIKDRDSFSARGAGILGMMQFGRQPVYALRSDMTFDSETVAAYLDKHAGTPILFFGFTFMAWRYAILPMLKADLSLGAPGGILIHSGGWKKLEAAKVSPNEFTACAKRAFGLGKVINFYGMVEQIGSVFFENEIHRLQTPVFADVLVRDPQTLNPVPAGTSGLLQVFSILPHSYPGHSLLTADIGRIDGVDHTDAGGFGRYFEVLGRAPRVEVRGCSDTYEQPITTDVDR